MKTYKNVIMMFRRDLRLTDNTALLEAARCAETVIPVFFLDPRQLKQHAYFSAPGLSFMLECLQELDTAIRAKQGKLVVLHDRPEDALPMLIKKYAIDAVYANMDYTPFSRRRDEAIARACKQQGARLHRLHDVLLIEPGAALKKNLEPYTVFTPFYKNALKTPVKAPARTPRLVFRVVREQGLKQALQVAGLGKHPRALLPGGMAAGRKILAGLKQLHNYAQERDYPALSSTSHLSAYLKFGCVSIRQAYAAVMQHLGTEHPLLRQLYWHDFYTHIAWHFPHVFGNAFQHRYNDITWENNRQHFKAWCEGRTGFPIVDAGMRELNNTGFMHNRVRMIVASFFVKDLHIDWRWGERYFANKLIDYDPALNNGNWQWAASTGCDAQPYFRIFNPWLQQKKFDPDCLYIKKWIPELAGLPARQIHKLEQHADLLPGYPASIVEHKIRAEQAKQMFRRLAG